MKQLNIFLLFSFCFISSIFANVAPRYKAHLFLRYVVINGDSLFTNGLHEVEMPFYEESEMTHICTGKDGEMGAKTLGRPVWRSGKIDHDFIVQYYYKKLTSDKWVLINEKVINDWQTPYTMPEVIRNKYETQLSNSFGRFEYRYNVKVELLQSEYTVEEDSSFLSTFIINIKSMRINGKKVKLNDSRFERKYKSRGELLVGKFNKKPISIIYEVNKGTANTIGEYEIILYYSYFDIKTGETTKKYLSTKLFNILNQSGYETYQSKNNQWAETVFIEYNVKVYKLN